eukprot:c18538_g4_i1 orf=29-466(-)
MNYTANWVPTIRQCLQEISAIAFHSAVSASINEQQQTPTSIITLFFSRIYGGTNTPPHPTTPHYTHHASANETLKTAFLQSQLSSHRATFLPTPVHAAPNSSPSERSGAPAQNTPEATTFAHFIAASVSPFLRQIIPLQHSPWQL